MDIQEQAKLKRPEWTESTVRAYYYGVRNVYGHIEKMDKPDVPNMQWAIDRCDEVLAYLASIEHITKRVNRLNAIIAYLQVCELSCDAYLPYQKETYVELRKFIKNNKVMPSDKSRTWLTYEKFTEIVNLLTAEVNRRQIFNCDPKDIDLKEVDILQQLLLLRIIALMPLSLIDLCHIQTGQIETLPTVEGTIVQTIMLHAHDSRPRKIILPSDMSKLMTFYLSIRSDKQHIFYESRTGEQMKAPAMSKLINRAFVKLGCGKKVSINELRSVIISNTMGEDISLSDRYRASVKIMRNKMAIATLINK